MNSRRHRSMLRGHVLMTLALMALVMRVMVPAGFMMGEAPSGAFAIVICSPDGDRTVSVDLGDQGGHDKSPADIQKHDAPCVFAGHGVANVPPFSPAPAPTVTAAVSAPQGSSAAIVPGRGLAAPPPPATGPPAVVI